MSIADERPPFRRQPWMSHQSQDGSSFASVTRLHYSGSCCLCGALLRAADEALLVGKTQPANTTGRTLLYCLDCLPGSGFLRRNPTPGRDPALVVAGAQSVGAGIR